MVVAIALVSGGLWYALKGPEIFFAIFAAAARMLLDLLPRMVVALLSGWSILTINRFVTWELPLTGGGYAARRMLASALLPPPASLSVAGLDRRGRV
jgi:hypothetical protein